MGCNFLNSYLRPNISSQGGRGRDIHISCSFVTINYDNHDNLAGFLFLSFIFQPNSPKHGLLNLVVGGLKVISPWSRGSQGDESGVALPAMRQ